jgi:hypothetical protein
MRPNALSNHGTGLFHVKSHPDRPAPDSPRHAPEPRGGNDIAAMRPGSWRGAHYLHVHPRGLPIEIEDPGV